MNELVHDMSDENDDSSQSILIDGANETLVCSNMPNDIHANSLCRHQSILHANRVEARKFEEENGDNDDGVGDVGGSDDMWLEPVCGTLLMHGNYDELDRVWCQFVNGVFMYRSDGDDGQTNELTEFEVTYYHVFNSGDNCNNSNRSSSSSSGGIKHHSVCASSSAPDITSVSMDRPNASIGQRRRSFGSISGRKSSDDRVPPMKSSSLPPRSDDVNIEDLSARQFWSYVFKASEGKCENCIFLVSPVRTYLFLVESESVQMKFVNTIDRDLRRMFSTCMLNKKMEAMSVVLPFVIAQFVEELNRRNAQLASLAKVHVSNPELLEDQLPITSARKEKSGVLSMEYWEEQQVGGSKSRRTSRSSRDRRDSKDNGADVSRARDWKDFYFVLFEGCLYFYKDSKSTNPAGFVVLKYASILLDAKRLSQGQFVFRVQTPLRVVICRSKHAVALSEWVAALEHTVKRLNSDRVSSSDSLKKSASFLSSRIAQLSMSLRLRSGSQSRPQSNSRFKDRPQYGTQKLLRNISDLMADISTMEKCIAHPQGLTSFLEFLRRQELEQLTRIADVTSSGGSTDDLPLRTYHYLRVYSRTYGLTLDSSVMPQRNEESSMSSSVRASRSMSTPEPMFMSSGPVSCAPQSSNIDENAPAPTRSESVDVMVSPDSAESPLIFVPFTLYLHFFHACEHFRSLKMEENAASKAFSIYDRFLADKSPDLLDIVPKRVRDVVRDQIEYPFVSMFDASVSHVKPILNTKFQAFKETHLFQTLIDMIGKKVAPAEREVAPFQANHTLGFMLKVKSSKSSKVVKLDRKSSVCTIGRDKSNDIVIEDSRVSRSHGRVQYNDKQCEYIDLGSSCGSKLNGRSVLRAKLRPGDVLELGQSTLIFHLKKKWRFAFLK